MRIPRHWRLNSQRYAMQGVTCSHCLSNIFPPREVCPYCEGQVEATFAFDEPRKAEAPVAVSATFERAAR
jgi:uncharacterized OB-fold protein